MTTPNAKTPSELTKTYTTPLPGDLYLSAHSASSADPKTGKVLASDLVGSGGGGASPSNTPATALGASAQTGSSLLYARADHVHPRSTASEISVTPAGTVSSTTVQAAIAELDSEKQAVAARGVANGYAPLDASALVPEANLPDRAATHVTVAATGGIIAADLQATLSSLDTRISALTQSLTLAGTYDPTTDTVSAIAGQGLSNGVLPAPGVGNNNRYLIVTATGTGIGNAAGLGTLNQGNWIYSNGTAWIELEISSGTIAATNVAFTPTGAIAATNVQAAIAELEVEKTPVVRGVLTEHSLTGGGSFSANRTLSLVGDTALPGNNKVYGTDASGNRGWKDDPAGGGGTTKLPFRLLSISIPTVSPVIRGFLAEATSGLLMPTYEFAGNADNQLDVYGFVDQGYANGDVTVRFHFSTNSNTGTVGWQCAFMRLNATVDPAAAFTFTFQSSTVGLPAQQRALQVATITFTKAQANSIAAGDPFVLRIKRLGSDTNTAVVSFIPWTLSVREV